MTLAYSDTKSLVDFVLETPFREARKHLHWKLQRLGRNEPEFYSGIIEHGPYMHFTSDEWFDFHRKIPVAILRDDSRLMNKLSQSQLHNLPSVGS